MANPSPAAIAWIQGRSPDWSQSDTAIAAGLNAATVANPVPQGQVGAPFSASDVFMLISPASCAKVLALPAFDATIRPLLDDPNPKTAADNRQLNQWAAGLAKAGALAQTEFDALAAPAPGTSSGSPVGLFNQVIADPSWAAQVPATVAALGRTIDADDVAASRPTGA